MERSCKETPVPRPRTKGIGGRLGQGRKGSQESVCSNSLYVYTHRRRASEPSIKNDVLVESQSRKVLNTPPPCQHHPNHKYDQYCFHCEVPVCFECVTSGEHDGHDVQNVSIMYDSLRELITKDTQELENFISPFYDTVMSDIEVTHKVVANKHHDRKKTILELRKDLRKMVDDITERLFKEEEKMEADDISSLQSLEKKFLKMRNRVRLTIEENHKIMNDANFPRLINHLFRYTSKNQFFRDVPERFEMVVSDFNPSTPNENDLSEKIGKLGPTITRPIQRQRLPALRKVADKNPKTMGSTHCVLDRVKTGFVRTARVSSSPQTDEFYVCGDNKVIKHFRKKELLEEISTLCQNEPFDLTVNKDGHLVYSDYDDGSVNIVKNGKTERLLKLLEWRPQALCCTSANELLVTMRMEDRSQSKIVRYSCYSECKVMQEIQYNESRTPLYSNPAFIEENKNLDIIVSDWSTRAIVVVTKMGKFHFSYTGNLQANRYRTFNPYGVATDNSCHILIADFDNNVVHIIDKSGHFLLYLDSCHLYYPWDLSVDSNDILYVAECYSNDVKRIKYLK
ncbi:uncharacterized protein LOC133200558 [Saccostrea echinata]|uniref:uncharacterized protein LOC133200558 n=1 Tax=Saccostrea echinata TaxID=191078 RepID=UPI002A7ED1D6|nr:uncharacterized protein LOC133200558 [Saccostrea echinata]